MSHDNENKHTNSGAQRKQKIDVHQRGQQHNLADLVQEVLHNAAAKSQNIENLKLATDKKYKNKLRLSDKRVAEIVDARMEIAAKPAFDADSIVYMPRILLHSTLPYKNPPDNPAFWERKNGNYSLIIRPGIGKDKDGNTFQYEYPYGKWPRLILPWVGKEVLEHQSKIVHLGRSINEFLKKLEVGTGGRNRALFQRQFESLFAAEFSFHFHKKGEKFAAAARKNQPLAKSSFYFWDWRKTDENQASFDSYIELDQEFYDQIIQHGVPLDLRALFAFGNSCFDMDLYSIMTYEAYLSMIGKRQDNYIAYEWLAQRLGANYSSSNNFKIAVTRSLKRISGVWKELKISQEYNGGFKLLTNRPHVEDKKTIIQVPSIEKALFDYGQAKRNAKNER
jgi:hypothetical protein